MPNAGPHASPRPCREVARVELWATYAEYLERRRLLTVTATFNPATGVLSVSGDALGNTVVVSRDAAGAIAVNGGAVPIAGGAPTVANTSLVEIFGQGGNDGLSLDEANGALPAAQLFGGAGNDTLTGGSGNDRLSGQGGSDTLFGRGGDDTFAWGPGDGSDTAEGQDGADTLQFDGANANENFDLSANGSRLRLTRDVGNIIMDVNGVETVNVTARGGADNVTVNDLTGTGVNAVNLDLSNPPGTGTGDGAADTVTVNGTNTPEPIDITGSGTGYNLAGLPALVNVNGSEGANDALTLNALGGADTINASTLPAGIAKLTIDAGAGADLVLGSRGPDLIIGGANNDVVTGGPGDDTVLLGTGNDSFTWNLGDGSDTVEGQGDTDRLTFNGSNADETFDVSTNGSRLRLTRNVGNVTMDLAGFETVDLNAAGGADGINVGDLTGAGLPTLNLDLANPPGFGGDGQPDGVTVNGTSGNDIVAVDDTPSGQIRLTGLPTVINVLSPEGANDSLTVRGRGGNDTIDAAGLPAGFIQLTLNGGAGDDHLLGSAGDDTALMGAGDDTFTWNPGGGSDVLEGQAGTDTLVFNGSNAIEDIQLSANGSRLRLARDVANTVLDADGIERVNVTPLGGLDTVTIDDLTCTAVRTVNVDLAAATGIPDQHADIVNVNGTSGNDAVLVVAAAGGGTSVVGLAATVNIVNTDPDQDTLVVSTRGGNDFVAAAALPPHVLLFIANGEDGNDILIGSVGNDVLIGGAGNDLLIGGPGNDLFNPGPGQDIVIQ